jgi:hypothetical protein
VISTEARAKYNEAQRQGNHKRFSASRFGRRTSISFVIRVGDADRKPTVKIHI